jgi:AraC-like DNA-binding protein
MSHINTTLRTLSLAQFGPRVQNTGYMQIRRGTEYRYRLDWHHLILLDRGRIEAETIYGPVNAEVGQLVCLRPAPEVVYRVPAGTAYYQVAVRFAPPPRHLMTPELPGIGPLPMRVEVGESFNELRAHFETICIELPQAGPLHHFRVQAAVCRILADIVASITHSVAPLARLDPWERVRLRLATFQGDDFSLRELARELGVSTGHFLRVFKQRFGITTRECRMRARLGEAVWRLRETDASIKATAYGLGFDGVKGLTRAMKKHLGLTASDVRHAFPTRPGLREKNVWPAPYPSNRHLLPPGDTVALLMKRGEVQEREL